MININEKIRKSNLKLICDPFMYFGILLSQYELRVEQLPENMAACVKFYQGENLDKCIHINKQYLENESFDYKHLTYIRIHELLHVLNKHGSRQGTRRTEVYQVACEHTIEAWLKHELSSIKPPDDCYHVIWELDRQLPRCTVEQAYEWLLKNANFITITKNNGAISVKQNGGGFVFAPHESLKDGLLIDQMLAEARALFENLKQRGSITGGMADALDKILKVKIQWNKVLEEAIKQNVSLIPDGRSWHQPNKYFISLNMYLPGISYIENTEVHTLILGIDTSGSILMRNLQQFAGVILDSVKYFSEVRVLVHDIDVHQDVVFRQDEEQEVASFVKQVGFKGRGGTSHVPIFDKIEDIYEKDKDSISMAILLTDGHSDIESNAQNYDWIKTIPTFFIITESGTIPKIPNSDSLKVKCIKID